MDEIVRVRRSTICMEAFLRHGLRRGIGYVGLTRVRSRKPLLED